MRLSRIAALLSVVASAGASPASERLLARIGNRCFEADAFHTWVDGGSPGRVGWRVCPGRSVTQTSFEGKAISVNAGASVSWSLSGAVERFERGDAFQCPADGRRRSSLVTYACQHDGPVHAITASVEEPVCSYRLTLLLPEACADDGESGAPPTATSALWEPAAEGPTQQLEAPLQGAADREAQRLHNSELDKKQRRVDALRVRVARLQQQLRQQVAAEAEKA